MRECDALRAKVDKLEIGLVAMRNAPNENKMKIEELESQVASDTKGIAHLTMLVTNHGLNSTHVAAENGEL